MIEDILPTAVKATHSLDDVAECDIYDEEVVAVSRAVIERRQEFATGRRCARLALRELGVTPDVIPKGEGGAPVWPWGTVGSITHCGGYRAAAVAFSRDILTIGIDAEPNLPLPQSVGDLVASPLEREWIGAHWKQQPSICWDRLLFSAKESVFKAWFPVARRWLGFEDVTVLFEARGEFRFVSTISPQIACSSEMRHMTGRWVARGGLLATAIVIPQVTA